MALRPQGTVLRRPTPLRQATPLRQPIEALLEDMPVELTVALLVRLMALRRLALLRRCMPVIRPSLLALVRRPMQLLLHHMPQTLPSRTNGTPLLARINAAICALPTSIPCVVMDTNRRVRPPKDERHSPLILSPAPLRGFFFAGRSGCRAEHARRQSRWFGCGCAISAPGSPKTARQVRPSTTVSNAGARLPASSTTGAWFTAASTSPFLRPLCLKRCRPNLRPMRWRGAAGCGAPRRS
jgi:hypothetical protein